MNKFKIIYIVLLILALVSIITTGFDSNTLIYSYDENDLGIVDGFQGSIYISIINCIILAILFISVLIITIKKENMLRFKWLSCMLLFVIISFIPIGIHMYSGGIAGIIDENSIYWWNILMYIR